MSSYPTNYVVLETLLKLLKHNKVFGTATPSTSWRA